MMFLATVEALGRTLGQLDLSCPQLAEGHTLRSVEPLTTQGSWTLPSVGERVILVRLAAGSKSFRWMANRIMDAPAAATADRHVLYSPSGEVVVVLDDDDGKVKLGGVSSLLPVARKTDRTLVDSTTDTPFTLWMTAVTAFLTAIAPSFNAVIPTPVVGLGTGAVVPPVDPGSVTGKIDQGSDVVEAV